MRAEKTGQQFEAQVDLVIRDAGFTQGRGLWRLHTLGLLPLGKYYERHADVGLSAVGGKTHRQVDILLINTLVTPTFIHCYEDKWQQSPGSAERKLDSVVSDAEQTWKHSRVGTTIIYGGPGFNPDRIAYHKRQVNGKWLCAVCSLDEFIAAVNNGCLNGGSIITIAPPEMPEYKSVSLWEVSL